MLINPLSYDIYTVEKLTIRIERERTGTINLLCKLENSDRMIKVCRFLRLTDNYALNVDDGLGSDQYRFYGKGLMDGECGISIENPQQADKGLWKCFVTTLIIIAEKPKTKSFGHILDVGEAPTSLRCKKGTFESNIKHFLNICPKL